MSDSVSSSPVVWQRLFGRTPLAVRQRVRGVVDASAEAIADAFYTHMLADPEAAAFLTHEAVQQRLRGVMQQWLHSLFGALERADFELTISRQQHTGEVHARIDLPVTLMARGARVLKDEIARHLLTAFEGDADLAYALRYAGAMVDIAFEVMSAAYVRSHEHAARTDEAYRALVLGQNMALERERQRAALLDWENHFYYGVAVARGDEGMPGLGESPFGLWLRHRASVLFEGAMELPLIRAAMASIDDVHLPACVQQRATGDDAALRQQVRAMQAELGTLQYHLASMFERYVDMENGKDPLTQLLNRRFLPAILGREADIVRRNGGTYALLMLDVDHFKRVNDTWGHEAGDRVLQHVAGLILGALRSGDFVFRYGGEEFLALLVETGEAQAVRIAETLRQRIAATPVVLANEASVQVAVSIGICGHDGHPDYLRLVRCADERLYEAKRLGRNRCVPSGTASSIV